MTLIHEFTSSRVGPTAKQQNHSIYVEEVSKRVPKLVLSLVGQPIGNVEDEEHGRRDPHGPSVDVLAELVHGRVHAAVVDLRVKLQLAFDAR